MEEFGSCDEKEEWRPQIAAHVCSRMQTFVERMSATLVQPQMMKPWLSGLPNDQILELNGCPYAKARSKNDVHYAKPTLVFDVSLHDTILSYPELTVKVALLDMTPLSSRGVKDATAVFCCVGWLQEKG